MTTVSRYFKYFRKQRFAYFSILPALLLVALIAFYPLGYTIFLTFTRGGLTNLAYAGFRNYKLLFMDEYFYESLYISIVYTGASTFLTIIFGLVIGILLSQPEKGVKVFSYLLLLPWAVSYVVAGILWKWVLNAEFGALNEMISFAGFKRINWLGEPTSALIMLIIVGMWKMLPFAGILFFSAMISLPREVFESARIDGAGGWQILKTITVPLLRPTFLILAVILSSYFFNFITLMLTITGGGPSRSTTVLPLYMYDTAFSYLRFGYGSVLALVIFFLNIGFALGYIRIIGVEKEMY